MIKGKQAKRNKKLEVRNWKLEMRSKKNWKERKAKKMEEIIGKWEKENNKG